MMEQATEHRTCVDARPRGRPKALKFVVLFLQLIAGAGVLILLFVAQALMMLWNLCAWGTRSWRGRILPVGRNAFGRICSWRRILYVFYLGTLASWSSSDPSRSLSLDRVIPPGEVRTLSSSDTPADLFDRSLAKNQPIGIS